VPVEIYGAAFDFRGDRALICTLRDVGMRKAAELELAESRDALRALTQHLETVREEERVQVARDLHDELGSVLTALKIDLAEALEGDAESARELVMGMSGLVDQAIEVGRRVTARLRPGILDDLGLAAAAEWLGTDLERRTGIRCSVVLPRNETDLPEPVATTMFRILQEALTNVIRHAGADRVEIALESDDTGVALTVVDNGRGFDPAALTGSGFGLLGMRERVRSFGGVFDVTSGPGAGTSIRVALPVAPSA
jgi:signal transduction histidine kinase